MRKKRLSMVLLGILLISTFSVLPVTVADIEDDIEASIEAGISWLVTSQWSVDGFGGPDELWFPADGGWGGPWEEDRTSMTALALIKLQDRAYELGYDSPFDPDYVYSDEIIAGWGFLFSTDANGNPNFTIQQQLSSQNHIGGESNAIDNPDVNGNGYGICFHWSFWHQTYTTGIVLMALEASGTPNRPNEGGLDFNGDGNADTYKEIAQESSEWLAYAQGDSGNDEGGWGYTAIDNGDNDWTDNSNGGYAMLGLAAAQSYGCNVPDWVRVELNAWIGTIQDPVNGDPDDGGSYYNPDWLPWDPWVNELKTGNLIFEMTYYGDDDAVSRFQDALDYIVRHWPDANQDPGWRGSWGTDDDGDGLVDEDTKDWLDNDGDGWVDEDTPIANYQAMFCLMKGFEYSGIDIIDLDGDSTPEHDWYLEFAQAIIDGQYPNGRWQHGYHGNDILNTCWALLTLEKVSPPPPTIPVFIDIKPGSWPNPINKDKNGVTSIAICGTEDFDVTTIDPSSVMLYMETSEVGVPPLRWSYEDVATPYPANPDDPEGHDEEGDGYVDLVFKFKTPEFVETLELCEIDDWEYIKLYLKGNLSEDDGGTPIEGFDWVRIQSSKGKGKK